LAVQLEKTQAAGDRAVVDGVKNINDELLMHNRGVEVGRDVRAESTHLRNSGEKPGGKLRNGLCENARVKAQQPVPDQSERKWQCLVPDP
jgi:hypothetical protein